jgi:hypothetical protein
MAVALDRAEPTATPACCYGFFHTASAGRGRRPAGKLQDCLDSSIVYADFQSLPVGSETCSETAYAAKTCNELTSHS